MSTLTGITLLALIAILAVKGVVDAHWLSATVWSDLKIPRVVIGMGHGVVLYPIYLVVAFNFAIAARVKWFDLIAMLLCGFIPGLAFWMKGYITKKYAA
jgi:integral membrane protein